MNTVRIDTISLIDLSWILIWMFLPSQGWVLVSCGLPAAVASKLGNALLLHILAYSLDPQVANSCIDWLLIRDPNAKGLLAIATACSNDEALTHYLITRLLDHDIRLADGALAIMMLKIPDLAMTYSWGICSMRSCSLFAFALAVLGILSFSPKIRHASLRAIASSHYLDWLCATFALYLMLFDSDFYVRIEAASLFMRIWRLDVVIIPLLVRLLNKAPEDTQIAMIYELLREFSLDAYSNDLLPLCMKHLHSSSRGVQLGAIRVLGRMGTKARGSLTELRGLRKGADRALTIAIDDAIAKIERQ